MTSLFFDLFIKILPSMHWHTFIWTGEKSKKKDKQRKRTPMSKIEETDEIAAWKPEWGLPEKHAAKKQMKAHRWILELLFSNPAADMCSIHQSINYCIASFSVQQLRASIKIKI